MSSGIIVEAPPKSARTVESQPTDSSQPTAQKQSLQWGPLAALFGAIAFYLALCGYLLHGEFHATGTFTFPLDDTYIAMALSKNFALHGVWGLNPSGFQSATSSPSIIFVMGAAFRIFGLSEWVPLALSLAFGLCALVAARRLLAGEPLLTQAIALAAVVFFAPLHVIGILGMEHALHILLTFVFLQAFSTEYARGRFPSWGLLLITAAMVSTRYEGLFFATGAGLLLLLQKRLGAAIALGAAAAAPVVTYGIVSVLHGCYWLPHSISLKGVSGKAASRSPIEIARHFAAVLGRGPYLGALVALMIILLALPTVRADLRRRALLVVAGVGTLLHLALADVGWVYRYEAYVVAAGIVAMACAVSAINLRQVSQRWAAAACLLVAAHASLLLYQRTAEANLTIPMRSLAIYCQQIQMARFLHQFEQGATVAANDVGTINYFADINASISSA
jgi:hypothetical protein